MPPRLARLLAIIAALVLVGGAFAVRSLLADDDADGGSGSGGGEGSDQPIRLLCDADLGDAACEAAFALDGVDASASKVMRAGDALDALSAEEVAFDAWLTLDPWPKIVDVERQIATLAPLTEDDEVLPVASSGLLVLSLGPDALDCGAPVSWDCLTTAAGSEAIGVPSLETALGTLTLGHAASGLVGDTDFGIGDIVDSERATALTALLDSTAPEATFVQANRFVTAIGTYPAIVTTTGLAEATAGSNAGRNVGAQVLGLVDMPTIGVVLAPIGARGADALERLDGLPDDQTVRDALTEAGFSGDPARSAGLPDPDVIYALRTELGP